LSADELFVDPWRTILTSDGSESDEIGKMTIGGGRNVQN
jgi:hypothetical protein